MSESFCSCDSWISGKVHDRKTCLGIAHHPNPMRVKRRLVRRTRNADGLPRQLDRIVQPHAALALSPDQTVADAHLPGKHMQPLSRDGDVQMLGFRDVVHSDCSVIQTLLRLCEPRFVA